MKQTLMIVGSRSVSAALSKEIKQLVHQVIERTPRGTTFLSGGCASGADYYCRFWCGVYKLPYLEAVAHWADPRTNKRDKSAGLKRNSLLVEWADRCVAIWDGVSPGTRDSVNKAIDKGIPVVIKWPGKPDVFFNCGPQTQW